MCIDQFSVGCISKHLSTWENLITDPEVIWIVQGTKLEFNENPSQFSVGYEILSGQKSLIQKELIRKGPVVLEFLRKGAAVLCDHELEEFIPTVFLKKVMAPVT